MAWDSTLVTRLRVIINDLSTTPDYSDDRLAQLIAVAAVYVGRDVELLVDYTIDTDAPEITPDPTLTDSIDELFNAFVVMKAACLLDRGNARVAAGINGLSARLGPVSMDVDGRLEGFLKLLESGACSAYRELIDQYSFGNTTFIKAVFGAFSNNTFDPTYYSNNHYSRRNLTS